jgi:CheY-like chemotaxis protein
MNNNPILVVDDDPEDLETISMVAAELNINNPLMLFRTGKEMMDYLHSTEIKPALIICDINMPEQNGYEVKMQLDSDEDIPYKHISFVYLTTSAADETIKMAARLAVQGCYTKPSDYRELRQTIETIFKRFT